MSILDHTDARVRYYALQAANELEPLQPAVLQRLLSSEIDPEVQVLAQRLLANVTRNTS
jgi:hypothetical protein